MRITATGKNVEIAIQNGLLECGMSREEVQVNVIENGGLFKKAKVELVWGEDITPTQTPTLEETQTQASESEPLTQQEDMPTEEQAEVTPKQAKQKKVRVVDSAALKERCINFLKGLTNFVDNNAEISCTEGENELSFTVTSEQKAISKLIGFHGDNIKAIQLLLSGLKTRAENPIRIYLDVNGYKVDKQQSLVALANKTADQAVNIERNIHLDPMSAYDRRIIHTTLQEREDVTTESTGEGEKRHVVVKPVFKK